MCVCERVSVWSLWYAVCGVWGMCVRGMGYVCETS